MQTLESSAINHDRHKARHSVALFCVALLVTLLTGCTDHREKMPEAKAGDFADPTAVPVTVQPVSQRRVQRYVGLVGTLHGYEEMTLGAKVAGRVRKVAKDVSDRVHPGELLLEIEPTD